jgi:hypothetical protein
MIIKYIHNSGYYHIAAPAAAAIAGIFVRDLHYQT